ncbi:hypothetical protein B0H11DRAFT_2251657 [Mycena galericulata]|nr:hypothetical protein B0H11DRAFT_2251657 [Mycena galericulata]
MCRACYTEVEESLRRTIDSITQLKHDAKLKLLLIICTGIIVGSGNYRTTHIVLDILGTDPNLDPQGLFGAVLKQLDKAELYPPRSPPRPHPQCTPANPRLTNIRARRGRACARYTSASFPCSATLYCTSSSSAHSTHARAAAVNPAMLAVPMICCSRT